MGNNNMKNKFTLMPPSGRDARRRSGTTGWRTSSGGRSIRPRPTPPIGRPARWPGKAAFRRPRSGAFGTPSGCSRTVRRPSGSPATPISQTRSATSWALTCRHRTGRWCCASMRRAGYGSSTPRSPCRRCARGSPNGGPTTTGATGRPRRSPPPTSPPASSSANAAGAIGPRSSRTS